MRGQNGLAVLAVLYAACAGQTALAASAYDSGGTGKAERFVSAADRASYRGRYSEAIADDNKVLAISPSYGVAIRDRAVHEKYSGLFSEALADLDRVIAMHPDDMSLSMGRVEVLLWKGDGARALAALKHALTLPLFSSWHQSVEAGTYENGSGITYQVNGHMESVADEYSSIANQLLHNDDASLSDMQAILKLETEHPEHILAGYCYTAAVAGLLESAELACQESIDQNSHDIGQTTAWVMCTSG